MLSTVLVTDKTQMLKVMYVGPREDLFREEALAQEIDGDSVNLKLQFDNLDLPKSLTHNWTIFKRKHLEIIREVGRAKEDA